MQQHLQEDSRHGHWSFLGPGSEKKWHGTHTYKPNGKWDRVAEDMMLNISGKRTHRVPCIQCFGTRRFEKQRKEKLSVHFCGDEKTV